MKIITRNVRSFAGDFANMKTPIFGRLLLCILLQAGTVAVAAAQQSGRSTNQINIASSNPQFERTVLNLTNQARRENGLPALQWSESLARAARYHAAHMAKYRYFEHDTVLPDGRRMSPAERIAHFDKNYAGENIAWGQRTPQDAMKSWINSPGHRANMLNPDSKRLGVGYVRGYWVQVFGK